MQYRQGDATELPDVPVVLAHICNNAGGWGRGFVLAVSRRWAEPERSYRQMARQYGGRPPLGEVQFVSVGPEQWVANMVAQDGYQSRENPVPLRYEALEATLAKVAAFAAEKGAVVQMPKIGAGLGGGEWTRIVGLVERTMAMHAVACQVCVPGGRTIG